MLEGLEIVEIKKSEINNETRIDAEYSKKSYLEMLNIIKSKEFIKIEDFATVTDGIHTSIPYSESSNINLISATSPRENYFDLSRQVFITEEAHKLNPRTALKANDIIISTVGTIGNCAVVDDSILPANSDRHVGIVRISNDVSPYYVSTFLLSKFGRFQTLRESTGNVQLNLFIYKIRTLIIPVLSLKFQTITEDIITKAHKNTQASKEKYEKAEQLLFQELGINEMLWQTKGVAVNNKSFKESFAQSGRLDAEYYQPKYDIIQNHLKQFEQIKLKDLVSTPITSGSTPKAGDSQYYTDASDGIPFIRAVDIGNNRVSLDDLNYVKRNVHEGILKKTQLKHNDVLFSIAGTVGRCGIFDHNVEANINQACAILRFNEDIINRLYLIIFFNSEVGQQIIEKYARQGVQTNLNMDEIGNLQIPILAMPTQQQIASLIQQSFQLRKQSKYLLDIAKQAVEMAIETDEATAMAFIQANTDLE